MQIRTIKAESMEAALADVQKTLGPDPFIISTYESPRGRGVEVRVAVDSPDTQKGPGRTSRLTIDDKLEQRLREELSSKRGSANPRHLAAPGKARWNSDDLEVSLSFHNLPEPLKSDLIRSARTVNAANATLALGAALDARLTIEPVPARPVKPVMLIGGPGAGKTLTAAKLGARAIAAGADVCFIAAGDHDVAEQALNLTASRATSPQQLAELLDQHASKTIIIDTAATNPRSPNELIKLLKFVRAGDLEPILVAPASGDVDDAIESAKLFASLGARRMICTRLDASRRIGAMLAAIDAANLALAQVGVGPDLETELSPVNPLALARLLTQVPGA